MGRPTTRWVAPRRTASSGGRAGAWSAPPSVGNRIPGTTIQGPAPSASRSSPTSSPDATTPRNPACSAARARRSASKPRSGTPRPITCSKSAVACEVKTVTPTSARSPAAPAAACSMAKPPRQCTVAIATPSSRAAATAPVTVFGMSCHLRSRNTRTPRAVNSRTSAGPSRTKSGGPTFAQRRRGSRSASANASRPLGRSKATISSATVRCQLSGDALRQARVGEGRRADGDEGGAGVQVGARVGRGANPADPDHRDADAGGPPARREHADRQQGRPAHAAEPVAEPAVERAWQGIDEGDGVGAGIPGHLRHRRDVRERRRQFRDEGARRDAAAAADQVGERARLRTEFQSAGGGVGAGGVDLEGRDAGEGGQLLDDPHVVRNLGPGDVDQHTGAPQPADQPRQLVVPNGLEPGISEPHGVEHATPELGDARGRVTASRLGGYGLGHDAAERLEVDDPGDLAPEARRPGRQQDGVLEFATQERDCAQGLSSGRRAGRGGPGRGSAAPLSAGNTGARAGPPRPGTGAATREPSARDSGGRTPSARASESSAAAKARLAAPCRACGYGEVP